MARLNTQSWKSESVSSLHRPVVLVIDLINGFISQGPLADPAIAQAAEATAELLTRPGMEKAPVWFVCDTHEEGAAEFDAFPVHCLRGSEEAEVTPVLRDWVHPQRRIEKNAIGVFAAEGFRTFLDSLQGNEQVIVTGCCSDLCVLQAVLGLQSWKNQNNLKDLDIIVPADCVETYHIPETHEAAFWNEVSLANMAANGVCVLQSLLD